MFKAITEAFKKTEKVDPLTAATSLAAQENSVASARLKTVLCKFIDGEDCAHLPLIKRSL